MLESVQEQRKPPAIMSVIFTLLAIIVFVFESAVGRFVFAWQTAEALVIPTIILCAVLALAGFAIGVVAVVRAFRSGRRKALSILAVCFGGFVLLCIAALCVWAVVDRMTRTIPSTTTSSNANYALKATPTPTPDDTGDLKMAPNDRKDITILHGYSKRLVVTLQKGDQLTINHPKGIWVEPVSGKIADSTQLDEAYFCLAGSAGEFVFKLSNNVDTLHGTIETKVVHK